jgi:hypothetical protein
MRSDALKLFFKKKAEVMLCDIKRRSKFKVTKNFTEEKN